MASPAFREASGMKPNDLAQQQNPQMQADQSLQTSGNIPQQQMSEQMPQPQPAPTPTPVEYNPNQDIDVLAGETETPGGYDPSKDIDVLATEPTPEETASVMLGELDAKDEVVTDFAGLQLKRTKEGSVLVKRKGAKEFRELSDVDKHGLKLLASSYLDLPQLGVGGLTAGASIGLRAKTGAGLGTVISTILGGGLGYLAGDLAKERYNKMLKNPEDLKTLYVLNKVFPNEEAMTPTSPEMSGALGAAGEALGGLIDMGQQTLRSSKDFAKEALKKSEPILEEILKNAEQAGVDIDATDIARLVNPVVEGKLKSAAAGEFGELIQKEALSKSEKKGVVLLNAMNKFYDKYFPGRRLSEEGPGAFSSRYTPIKSASGGIIEPKANLNVIDFIEDQHLNILGRNRKDFSQLAQGEKVDLKPLRDRIAEALPEMIPGSEKFIKNGEIDSTGLMNYIKTSIPGASSKDFAKALNMLNENIAQGDVSFDLIPRITDMMQGMVKPAEKLDPASAPAARRLALISREFEDDTIANIAREKGRTELADRVLESKKLFSNIYEDVQNFKKFVSTDEKVVGSFLKMDNESAKRFLSLIGKENEKELGALVLDGAIKNGFDDLLEKGTIVDLNPQKLASSLIKSSSSINNLKLIFGESGVKKLEAINNLAEIFSRQAQSSAKNETLITKTIALIKSVPGLASATDYIDSLFSGNPNIRDILRTRIDNTTSLIDRSGKGIMGFAQKASTLGLPKEAQPVVQGMGAMGTKSLPQINDLLSGPQEQPEQ